MLTQYYGSVDNIMANRPRPDDKLIAAETKKLQKAVAKRERTQGAAEDAEMELRQTICDAFDNGLSAHYISIATGLTVSRCYQISRGVRT